MFAPIKVEPPRKRKAHAHAHAFPGYLLDPPPTVLVSVAYLISIVPFPPLVGWLKLHVETKAAISTSDV